MNIYLDESGDLGFDLTKPKTSNYLILTLLVCKDHESSKAISKAIKRTIQNKLPHAIVELKGNNTTLAIKKYFLKTIQKNSGWKIYTVIANKETWLKHHFKKHGTKFEKTSFYDEIAKRLISQVDFKNESRVDIIVDRSKAPHEIKLFDEKVISALQEKLPKNTKLSIDHHRSHDQAGLQAVDLFCWGISRKYEKNDIAWYETFLDRIAAEVSYKF